MPFPETPQQQEKIDTPQESQNTPKESFEELDQDVKTKFNTLQSQIDKLAKCDKETAKSAQENLSLLKDLYNTEITKTDSENKDNLKSIAKSYLECLNRFADKHNLANENKEAPTNAKTSENDQKIAEQLWKDGKESLGNDLRAIQKKIEAMRNSEEKKEAQGNLSSLEYGYKTIFENGDPKDITLKGKITTLALMVESMKQEFGLAQPIEPYTTETQEKPQDDQIDYKNFEANIQNTLKSFENGNLDNNAKLELTKLKGICEYVLQEMKDLSDQEFQEKNGKSKTEVAQKLRERLLNFQDQYQPIEAAPPYTPPKTTPEKTQKAPEQNQEKNTELPFQPHEDYDNPTDKQNLKEILEKLAQNIQSLMDENEKIKKSEPSQKPTDDFEAQKNEALQRLDEVEKNRNQTMIEEYQKTQKDVEKMASQPKPEEGKIPWNIDGKLYVFSKEKK